MVLLTSLLDAFMRAGRRHFSGFSEFSSTLAGRTAYIAALESLLVATVVAFSGALSVRDFLSKTGLLGRPALAGWYAGWVTLGLAVLNLYGATHGWTASSRAPAERSGHSVDSVVFVIATSIFLGPLVEELVTRGYLYQAFRASCPLIPSIGLIICFSAFFHAGSMLHSGFTAACLIALWVVLSVLREYSESLWNCVFCHVIYNAAVVRQWALCSAAMILFLLLCRGELLQLLGARRVGERNNES
jgi:membrane protease YdiL (CAAX protease family)